MAETGQPSGKLTHLLVPNATQSGGGGFTGTAYMQMVPVLEEVHWDHVVVPTWGAQEARK